VMFVRDLQIGYSHLKQIVPLQEWIQKMFIIEHFESDISNVLSHSIDNGVAGFLQYSDSSQFSLSTNSQKVSFAELVCDWIFQNGFIVINI
jgi:hypothetical protein